MSKYAKYFAMPCHGVMRLVQVVDALITPCNSLVDIASMGIAHALGYAKVLYALTTRHCTGLNILSRLSRICFKKSGQRKPNEYRLSRLSRLVPSIFNVYLNENEAARCVWCAGRELTSRHKTCVCNATVQLLKVLPGTYACGYEAARFSARLCELKLGQLAFLSLQLS